MERPLMDTPLLAKHTAEQRQQRTLRALCMGGEFSVMRDAWSVLGALAGWETNRVYDQYSGPQGMSQPMSDPLPAEDGEFVSFFMLLFGDRTQLPRSSSRAFNASDFNAAGIMPNQSVLLTALVQQFNESEIVKHILADVERVAHPVLVQAFARLALICNVSQRKWTHIRLREFELVRSALGFRENPMCSFNKVLKEFGELTKEIRDIMHHCCDDVGNVCVWVDQPAIFRIMLQRWRQHDAARFKVLAATSGLVEVEVITWKVDGAEAKSNTAAWGRRSVTRIFSQFVGMNVSAYTELSTHSLIRGAVTTFKN
jgi:hypothetical protein